MSIDQVTNAFSGVVTPLVVGGFYSGTGIGPDPPVWLGFDAANASTELNGVRVLIADAPVRVT
jgi:hypothetical protein